MLFYITATILAGIAAFFIIIYNALITLKNKCNEAWSDIDTQLKRRYDLIPNLVETVKGYAKHEGETFEKVVQARSAAMNAQTVAEKEAAENMLSKTLKSIFALSENYPELKANENFTQLQKSLTEIEEHIQLSRRYYNATVRDFNTKQEIFPNSLVANLAKFEKREFFQADDEEKQNVKVDFSKKKEESPKQEEETKPVETPAPETSQEKTPEPPETPDESKQ